MSGCDHLGGVRTRAVEWSTDESSGEPIAELCTVEDAAFAGETVDAHGVLLSGDHEGHEIGSCLTDNIAHHVALAFTDENGARVPLTSAEETHLEELFDAVPGHSQFFLDGEARTEGAYCVDPARLSNPEEIRGRLIDGGSCTSFGLSLFDPSRPVALRERMCETLAEAIPGTGEASESHISRAEGERESPNPLAALASETGYLLLMFGAALPFLGRMSSAVADVFGPDVWALLARSPAAASFLANSPRIVGLLSHFGIRAAAGVAPEAVAVGGTAAPEVVAGGSTVIADATAMVSGAAAGLAVLLSAAVTPILMFMPTPPRTVA